MMDDREFTLDDLMGMAATRGFMEIFRKTCETNQVTALTSAVSFFTQVLFLMPDDSRATLMTILDEMSALMNGEKDAQSYLKKLNDFDLKGRMETLAS